MSKYICLECGEYLERAGNNHYLYSYCDKKDKHAMLVKINGKPMPDISILKEICKDSGCCCDLCPLQSPKLHTVTLTSRSYDEDFCAVGGSPAFWDFRVINPAIKRYLKGKVN